jgi:hypothetical protein
VAKKKAELPETFDVEAAVRAVEPAPVEFGPPVEPTPAKPSRFTPAQAEYLIANGRDPEGCNYGDAYIVLANARLI